jgi:hypothetical protein
MKQITEHLFQRGSEFVVFDEQVAKVVQKVCDYRVPSKACFWPTCQCTGAVTMDVTIRALADLGLLATEKGAQKK